MRRVKKITELIGATPMLEIEGDGAQSTILAKLESFNPCSSVKERVALNMIEEAMAEGAIDLNTTLIEPTSGNTGIGLAMVAASLSMKLILTMPESMSEERKSLLKLLGAELVLTDKAKGMKGAIEKAEELCATIPNSYIFNQFANPANPRAHVKSTAVEIVEQLGDDIPTYFVAGVGTGGTISGIGSVLKAKYPNVKMVAVEPMDSPVLSGGGAGAHKIQGIGAGFVPANYDSDVVSAIMPVSYDDAIATLHKCAKTNGMLIGISSGAAMWAAEQVARREDAKGGVVVVLLPDSADRYLSML
ncbi:MAG: cysteine synthase A [Rikenellaceae bacterium]